MLLQPRKFTFKLRQKNRRFTQCNTNNSLTFGDAGLLLLRPILLTAHHLSRLKLFLKKTVRKVDKTRRLLWFHAFPHLPLTKKPDGLRMGKGKGKLACWFIKITGGTILFEFQNVRFGRALFFMRQATFKLGIPTKAVFPSTVYCSYPLTPSKKVFFRTFW